MIHERLQMAAMANGYCKPPVLLLFLLWTTSAHQSTITQNFATFGLPEKSNFNSLCNVSTTFQIASNCLQVTLTDDHLRYDSNLDELRVHLGSYNMGHFATNQLAGPNNQTLDFCFPLTPQLLNCKLRHFGPTCYQFRGHKLTIPGSNFSAELGDYYLDAEKNAFVCAESILPDIQRPRCNTVQLGLGQYVIDADGSIHINATGTTIRHPQYQVDEVNQKLSLCYPLSIPFLNCHAKSAMLLHNYLYDKKPEMKLYFRSFQMLYNVDEYYSMSNNDADFVVCTPENPLVAVILRQLYNTFRGLSCFLIIFTISHHLMAPKLTVHAKCLLSYYVSGMAFFIATMVPSMECYTFFVSIYLSSNAAVIWVNIASYDIWRSFTKLRRSPNNYMVKKKSDPYTYYCILGWGAPIVLCIFTLILDKYYRLQNVLFLSAMVGLNENCWYHDKWISFSLHFGFILILSMVNAIFFILTIYSIHKGSKGTELVNTNRRKQMYMVRFKLFIIMGCVLVMEGITWCIQEQYDFPFWYIADAFISVQGMAIFFAETCKRDAFRLMINRFRLNYQKLGRKWKLSFSGSSGYAPALQGSSSDTPVNV